MTMKDHITSRIRRRPVQPVVPAKDRLPGAPEQLLRRRDRLAEQVAELQFDLGGLVYEMAIRDHFRLDVLVKRAAKLQEADAELGEVERLIRMDESGTTGTCRSCGAVHSRGAVFCWQCGQPLLEQAASTAT
jgi:chorismate mutase